MKYYLIHGLDKKRRIFMEAQFRHSGISKNDVSWINQPNKDDPLPEGICSNSSLTLGQVAITYKHYLALQDIVKNKYEVAAIMEDNIEFFANVPEKINVYLKQLPDNWDLLFDSDFFGLRFTESPVNPERIVYKKKNEGTLQCHGASKGAHFYLVRFDAAKKLLLNFLPFDKVSDHFLNDLIRKLDLNTYWADPPNVHKIQRASTWR